jgi:hypothetical protein
MYDVFFISYKEPNCEENWQRVLSLHPDAKRIDNVKGIDVAHMMCHDMSNTDKFWTIDGDNWLFKKLDFNFPNDDELVFLNSLDAIDGEIDQLGGVKLWPKNKLINTDMSKGDFCKAATKSSKTIDIIISEHRYNTTPLSSWKFSFRFMVKGIAWMPNLNDLTKYMVKFQALQHYDDGKNNAIWAYRGFLDAEKYVFECRKKSPMRKGDFMKINLINDYDWLETKFNACAEDWQKL